eukprot:8183211-Heterocapsa_arctica.AAC.1
MESGGRNAPQARATCWQRRPPGVSEHGVGVVDARRRKTLFWHWMDTPSCVGRRSSEEDRDE